MPPLPQSDSVDTQIYVTLVTKEQNYLLLGNKKKVLI